MYVDQRVSIKNRHRLGETRPEAERRALFLPQTPIFRMNVQPLQKVKHIWREGPKRGISYTKENGRRRSCRKSTKTPRRSNKPGTSSPPDDPGKQKKKGRRLSKIHGYGALRALGPSFWRPIRTVRAQNWNFTRSILRDAFNDQRLTTQRTRQGCQY